MEDHGTDTTVEFEQRLLWSVLEHLGSLEGPVVRDAAALREAVAALQRAAGLSLDDEDARKRLALVSKK